MLFQCLFIAFLAKVIIFYPLKTPENLRFSGAFRGYKMGTLSQKWVNFGLSKGITTHDNGNVQSHDQEESKLNSTINANSGAHTLTHD